MAASTTVSKRRKATRLAKAKPVEPNGNGHEETQATALVAPVTRRRRRRRNTSGLTGIEPVDKAVLAALQTIRVVEGSDTFRAGIASILDRIEGTKPSRATAYRSVRRMAEQGIYKITREGVRGHFTYDFGAGTPTSVVSSTPPTPISRPTVSDDPNALIEEERNLDAAITDMMSQLKVRIDAKRARVAVLQAAVMAEQVPA